MLSRFFLCLIPTAALAASAHAITSSATAAQSLARADGSTITYYLERANASRASDRLLVVVQGSDCNSVWHIPSIRRTLVHALPGADLLTVEKYGITAELPYADFAQRPDCPAEYIRHDSLSQRAEDLDAALSEALRAHEYRQVAVIGGSEGAVVAHLLAARAPRVDATIAFNGGGQWFLNDLLHSIDESPMSSTERKYARLSIHSLLRHVLEDAPTDLSVDQHGYRWWHDVFTLNQLEVISRTSKPTLIVQGGNDSAVSPQSASAMVTALRKSGRKKIDYRTYPALDHRLADVNGQDHMPIVVEDMATWLKATLNGSITKK